jgi:ParB family chromosome partitioning protein
MTKKPSGLGRGLDALFPTDFSKESVLRDIKQGVQEVNLDLITPKKGQPRTVFDDEKIEQLSYSMKTHGVLQPIVLVETARDAYTIIAGERRFRAAKKAGLKTIPAVVRTATELQQLEIALVENIQREDLNPIEQAISVARLHDEFGQSYESIAKRLGKAHTTVVNTVRLLGLPAPYQQALSDGAMGEGHARALLALSHAGQAQAQLFKHIINDHWSVRKAELFVQAHKSEAPSTRKTAKLMKTESKETKLLEKKLMTPVRIQRTAKGGKLTIAFKDEEDLNRLLGIL